MSDQEFVRYGRNPNKYNKNSKQFQSGRKSQKPQSEGGGEQSGRGYQLDPGRQLLVDIYYDTLRKLKTGIHKNLITERSNLYQYMRDPPDIKSNSTVPLAHIEIIKGDTLIVAEQFVKAGNKTCAINMACAFMPGGSVRKGAAAQEECLFRRTSLPITLERDIRYPFTPPNVIHSPVIHVIKNEKYEDIVPWSLGFISAAMPRFPRIHYDGSYQYEDDYLTARRTIEHVFKVALDNEYDTLILGAMGCGAYKNPRLAVIEMFNEMIEKYGRCFKNIIFAIIDRDEQDVDETSDDDLNNYNLFKKYLIVPTK